MYTQVARPEALTADQLDLYLARGWYRMGQTVFTCHFVLSPEGVHSAVWIRNDLATYQFTRSHRKLLSSTRRNFTVSVQHAQVDAQREALYQRYLTIARGERAASLSAFLYGADQESRGLFDTWEVTIADGDKLVGLSYFDVGETSLQSLLGAYDPDYSKHSLGFVTLLLEIEHGLEVGHRFFYPGYVLPGSPAMDYKLRPSEVEFLQDGGWRPWKGFGELGALPLDRLHTALDTLTAQLTAAGVSARKRLYPFFEAAARDPRLAACLQHPLVVECNPDIEGRTRIVVVYDLHHRVFRLLRCLRAGPPVDWAGVFNPEVDAVKYPLIVTERLGMRQHAADLVSDLS